MAFHFPPSRTYETGIVVSLDPALDAPVRNDGEPDDAWEARLRTWEHRLTVARQTGEFGPLVKPEHRPTVFFIRPLPGSVWRQIPRVVGRMGAEEQMALLVRLALVRIENGPEGHELERAEHCDHLGIPTGLGQAVTLKTIDLLDRQSPDIVTELGSVVWGRRFLSGN